MLWALRWLLVATIVLAVGIYGLAAAFSDTAPDETLSHRAIVLALVLFAAGVVVGVFAGRRWWVSIALAWGPLAVGAMMLTARWRGVTPIVSSGFVVGFFAVPPIAALIGGFLGSRLARLGGKRVGPRDELSGPDGS